MTISAFCLTTNATKFGYPFIESIRSWLPVVDELIIIDGGSTDETVKLIEEIGDSKIRIIQDDDVKWEDEWYYSRMGHNFNRGYHECKGDLVVKFDIDYVLHEKAYLLKHEKINFRKACEIGIKHRALVFTFFRRNFILIDRFFIKTDKTLVVNKLECQKQNISVDYGLDIEKWSWGYEPIITDYIENNTRFGNLLKVQENKWVMDVEVFNYGFTFSTDKQIREIRRRHMEAESRQQSLPYKRIKQPVPYYSLEQIVKNPSKPFELHHKDNLAHLNTREQFPLRLEEHPELLYEKIKNLKPEQQGYNFWGNYGTAKYYK